MKITRYQVVDFSGLIVGDYKTLKKAKELMKLDLFRRWTIKKYYMASTREKNETT